MLSLAAVAGVAAGTWLLAGAMPASAHEEVKLGTVDFEIGFLNEPVYVGFQNGVFLSIHRDGERPVTNAADTLNVEVEYGTQTMQVALEPNFDADQGGAPGDYVAHFIPTRPGKYTFHLSGSMAGQQIDQSFTSGPTSFDEAVDPASVEFPAKDPTTGQLAERLDRDIPRIQLAVLTRAARAQRRASSARTLAVVGVALGALGLLTGVAALVVAARRGRPA